MRLDKVAYISLILYGVLLSTSIIFAEESVTLHDSVSEYPLGRYLKIAEDPERSWKIQDLISGRVDDRFLLSTVAVPYLKYTKSAYWVKFKVVQENRQQKPKYFLAVNNSIMDNIHLYIISPTGKITEKISGDIFPFESREYNHRNFLFELPDFVRGSEYSIVLRFESSSTMRLPLVILTQKALIKNSNTEQYLFGLYIGIFLAVSIYMLIIYFFLKEKDYLLFVFFATFYGLYLLSFHGVAYQIFWPELPFFQEHAMLFLGGITMTAGLFFTKYFLNTAKYNPFLDKTILLLGVISFPIALFLINSKFINKYLYSYFFMLISIAACLIAAVVIAFKRERMAYYYLVAQTIPAVTAIIYGLTLYRVIEVNPYIFYGPLVGSAFQLLLLAIGLSDRMRILLNKEKEAQQFTIKLLQQNEEHRIKLIQKEMNPHFLFNALDSIYYLLEKDQEKAASALIMLSDNYRFILSKASSSLISFEEEWSFVKNYLKIERLLMGEELSIQLIKNETLSDIQIPPLTLQPIIENCLKHGFKTKRKDCHISIYAERTENGLAVDVIDNGTGLKQVNIFEGTLGNVVKRLLYFYEDSKLTIQNNEKGGVKASFFIPVNIKPAA